MSRLYSDEHPKKSLKGTGFKDKTIALRTIKLIRKRSLHYQYTVIITMYNRAKYHPNKNKNMEEAMVVYKKWIDKYDHKKKKEPKLKISKEQMEKLDIKLQRIIKKYQNKLWKLKFIQYPPKPEYDIYSYLLYILKKK